MPAEMVREGWGELNPLTRRPATLEGLGDDSVGVGTLEMSRYMRNQLLRDADWAGMAHSVEIRVPLVDVQLLRDIAPYLYGPTPFRKPLVAQACGLDAGNRREDRIFHAGYVNGFAKSPGRGRALHADCATGRDMQWRKPMEHGFSLRCNEEEDSCLRGALSAGL